VWSRTAHRHAGRQHGNTEKNSAKSGQQREAALLAEIGESVEERAAGSDGTILISAARVRWLLAKAQGDTAKARRIADEPQLSPKSSRLIENAIHLAGVAARDDSRQLQRDADAAALALRRRVAQIERQASRARRG